MFSPVLSITTVMADRKHLYFFTKNNEISAFCLPVQLLHFSLICLFPFFIGPIWVVLLKLKENMHKGNFFVFFLPKVHQF